MSASSDLPSWASDPAVLRGFTAGTVFSLPQARAMLCLAQVAYAPPRGETVPQVLASWEMERPENTLINSRIAPDNGLGEVFAFAAVRSSVGFVALRGSDPPQVPRWLREYTTDTAPSGLHIGFEEAAHAVWEKLNTGIANSPVAADKPLFFTGHGIGGAMAVIVAFFAAKKGITVEAVYTFGMPRVGTMRFAEEYNAWLGDRTFRLVYGRDVVPTVPRADQEFQHVGRFFASNPDGRFVSGMLSGNPQSLPKDQWNNEPLRNPDLSNLGLGQQTLGLGQRVRVVVGLADNLIEPPAPLRDHFPDRYWEALRG
jgi:hypothetical protein